VNLLVTGGAGFIGSWFIDKVIHQPSVQKLVNLDCLTYAGNLENLTQVAAHPKYTFERADLRDKTDVVRIVREHRITHVVHLAAESHVDRSIRAPADFINSNILGTFHLLEACRAHWRSAKPENRFLQVSTDEVYGSLGAEGHFEEESPYRPNSPYAASKAAADVLVRSYIQTYKFPAMISHGSNTFGPRQFPEKLIPVVIRNIKRGVPIPVYGQGANVRDWLFVPDHADALWTILERGKLSESYNVAAHNERTNLELVETICDIADGLMKQPQGTSRKLISFVDDRPGHDFRYAMTGGKLERELGWRSTSSFTDSLERTIAWHLEQSPS
jgi:dTDP-glucose 4,6-dehydratase